MEKIELRDKFIDYLIVVYEKKKICPLRIGNEISYYRSASYSYKLTGLLLKMGLVQKEKCDGKTNYVVLTGKGIKVAQHAIEIKKLLLEK